ncbi:GAF domain nucleotide-binding protein [Phytophthora cinnamomi]|uniref:GAF domain nucleotide-binding protein n=1 Tax=Phytophthora cinnamomi TaxID=4785 RepID=UPI003559FF3C|nr:GAF domain nucleotide-binding protein [Phytophthora cinnamomi]
MARQLTPLDAALQLFASAQESAAALSESKPVVALSLPQEPDRKQKRELQKLLAPLAFLFRGRDDITLVQSPSSEITASSLAVFKDGAEAPTVTATAEDELKQRVTKLVEQIGWSPDCSDEAELHNYLSPINAVELMGDVAAFTATTGQRDYVANAANVSAIIWHAFVEAERPINWAGFYFVRPLANPKETDHDHILILGPFMGKPACSRIRFQSGVCGAAWRTKSVQRISDVHEFPGHIACDDASESELVVPVFDKQGEVIALIDLDCPKKNGFSAEDERTFVEVARVMSEACDWGNVGLPYTQP